MRVDVNAFVGAYPFRRVRGTSPEALLAAMDRTGLDEAWVVRYLVVSVGNWWPTRKVLVPVGWIAEISWFTYDDKGGDPQSDPGGGWMGLIRQDGTRKPSFGAYVQLARQARA